MAANTFRKKHAVRLFDCGLIWYIVWSCDIRCRPTTNVQDQSQCQMSTLQRKNVGWLD